MPLAGSALDYTSPAASVSDDGRQLTLLWNGSANDGLWYTNTMDGTTWTPQMSISQIIGGQTVLYKSSPSIASYRGIPQGLTLSLDDGDYNAMMKAILASSDFTVVTADTKVLQYLQTQIPSLHAFLQKPADNGWAAFVATFMASNTALTPPAVIGIFALVGMDCFPWGLEEKQKSTFRLQDFTKQAVGCEFCSRLSDLIEYRLRYDSKSLLNNGAATPDDTSDWEDATVSFSHELKEVRNWSFGFEGATSRKIVAITVSGARLLIIILQRSGIGGRVPVEFSSDGYGSDSVIFQPPGTWRLDGTRRKSSFYDVSYKEVARLEPTLGRFRPLMVDFDTIGSWIRMCDQRHKICQHHEIPVDIPQFRLINVEKMCIVQVDSSRRPPFATLSYVWGLKPFLRLINANLKDLQEPGCLKKLTLPCTIQDAITICAKLHIEHIWIDSLCIIQDDESDMIQVIDKMDSIYRESILTIVAATGSDAHTGIPGVRSGTRSIEQHSLEIRGVELIDSVDSAQFRFQGPFEEPLWISKTP
ncbi:unnamed protein product [Fusarium graminearum]|nr:unnamed protein product [Fusarium graminearum]